MIGRVVRAIILAAGASSRMGRPKAALRLSDPVDTFLSRLIRSFLTAGLPDIVVVTGAAQDEFVRPPDPSSDGFGFAHNADWRLGQLSSLLAGLDHPPATSLEARADDAG